MDNRRIMVITGTRKGIGRHLAEHYTEEGFQVIGCSRGQSDYKHKEYRHFCLDVSDETQVKNMFVEIYKAYKRVDILINNAGAICRNYALLTPLKTAQDIIMTNFIGTFLCSREAAKIMQKNRYGRIINVSTVAVGQCTPGMSVYSASKAAVEQFSKVLAKEVSTYGITVNTLAFSLVKGGGMAEGVSEESAQETLEKTASKSWLDIEDVVGAVNSLLQKNED